MRVSVLPTRICRACRDSRPDTPTPGECSSLLEIRPSWLSFGTQTAPRPLEREGGYRPLHKCDYSESRGELSVLLFISGLLGRVSRKSSGFTWVCAVISVRRLGLSRTIAWGQTGAHHHRLG